MENILTIPMCFVRFPENEKLEEFVLALFKRNLTLDVVQFEFFGRYKTYFRKQYNLEG